MTKEELKELSDKVNEVNSLQLKAILKESPEREKEIVAKTLLQLAQHEEDDHECSTSANILRVLAEHLCPTHVLSRPTTIPNKPKSFLN